MPGVTMILGPVVFQDFEACAGIRFGGEQRIIVHKLPGGDRVIDCLGRDDAEITMNGTFSGPDGTLRARALDELRAQGSVLALTWDVFFYSVVIRDFQADYRNSFWIPYRLVCTVLRDEAAALFETALSLAGSVVGDIAAAASQTLSGVDFSATQSAIAAPGAMTLGTASYNQATGAIGEFERQHRFGHAGCRNGVGSGVRDARNHERPRHGGDGPDLCHQLRRSARSTRDSKRLHRTGGYQPGQCEHLMRTLVSTGGNLFQIAAQQLGDATQWIRIAQLNQLSDPMLTGIVTLLLPDVDPTAGGGVAAQ